MLRNDKRLKRKRKSYYPFSKDYPGRSHSGYAIGETRERRKREQRTQILYALSMVLLFLVTFFLVFIAVYLSKRPIEDKNSATVPAAKEQLVALPMPGDALSGGIALDLFLDDLAEQHANAVLVDFKLPSGYLTYTSTVQKANDIGASSHAYASFAESISILKVKGYKIIARYNCFEDALAASQLTGAAVTEADGVTVWLDNSAQKDGKPWLNPYSETAWSYLTSLLKEAPEFGADYVLLCSVQFPTGRLRQNATFLGESAEYPKTEALKGFLNTAKTVLDKAGIPFAVELSVADILYGNDLAYGGTFPTETQNFLAVNFAKTPETEKLLSDSGAGFAALDEKEMLVPAVAAVTEKLRAETESREIFAILGETQQPDALQNTGIRNFAYHPRNDT